MTAARPASTARFLRMSAIPIAVLLLWEIVPLTGIVSATKLPPLSAVLGQAWELLLSGELLADIGASLSRVAAGFAVTLLIGVTLGFVFSQSWLLGKLFDPLMQALRLTPIVAAAPLFILWFGFGEISKVAIVAAMGVFAMYRAAFTAFRSVSPELIEVTRVLGLGRAWYVGRFLLPASAPRIIAGARFALLLSWMSLPVAEQIGTNVGIGHLAMSGEAVSPENVFVGTILFAVFVKLTDWGFVTATRPLLSWENSFAASRPRIDTAEKRNTRA